MTLFKVTYSADTLEGLTALSGLPASIRRSESVSTTEGILPPPNPLAQSMEALDNMAVNPGLVAPPPIPEEYGLLSEGLNRNGLTPPTPPMQSTGISDGLASSSDQVAPPPLPISEGITEDGGSFQTDAPPPPVPDSLIPNAGGDQAEVGPPPGPTKRKTKRPKKAAKT